MNKGRIVQVMGPVVDVVFENGDLPFIKDALEVENNGKKCIMEVAQHLGNNDGTLPDACRQRRTLQGYGSHSDRSGYSGTCR